LSQALAVAAAKLHRAGSTSQASAVKKAAERLQDRRRELERQWHPTKNGSAALEDFPGRNKAKPWWKCERGHEYRALLFGRLYDGTQCPLCRIYRGSLVARGPARLLAEWHPTKNLPLTPDRVRRTAKVTVWWLCSKDRRHEWASRLSTRAEGKNCPYCSGTRVTLETSLSCQNPRLAAEWHPTKNGTLTPAGIHARSSRSVWWQCPAAPDHVWRASVDDRSEAPSCPFCAGRRFATSQSLAVRMPELAKLWHPTKNGSRTAWDVAPSWKVKRWWRCPKGPDHEWQQPIYARPGVIARCPFCTGSRASVTNSLACLYPNVAAEWHPTRNGPLTPAHVLPGSNKKVWWRCDLGHEWKTMVTHRTTNESNCPECWSIRRRSQRRRKRRGPRIRVLLPSDFT
jgi:hypothetical protein